MFPSPFKPQSRVLFSLVPLLPEPYVPQSLQTPVPMFPEPYVPQSLQTPVPMLPEPYVSQSLQTPVPMLPSPMFPSPFKPQSRCSPDVFACPYIPTNIHLVPPVPMLSEDVAQPLCPPPPQPPPPPHPTPTHTHIPTPPTQPPTPTPTPSPYVPQTSCFHSLCSPKIKDVPLLLCSQIPFRVFPKRT